MADDLKDPFAKENVDLVDPFSSGQESPEGLTDPFAPSTIGTFGREAALGVLPGAAGLAAGIGVGALAVAALPATLPVAAATGIVMGAGLLVAGIAGWGAEQLQEWGLNEMMGDEWYDDFNKIREEAAVAHPTAAFTGGMAGMAATMGFSPGNVVRAATTARGIWTKAATIGGKENIWSKIDNVGALLNKAKTAPAELTGIERQAVADFHNMINVSVGAGTQAGFEAWSQIESGNFQPVRLLGSLVAGSMLNNPSFAHIPKLATGIWNYGKYGLLPHEAEAEMRWANLTKHQSGADTVRLNQQIDDVAGILVDAFHRENRDNFFTRTLGKYAEAAGSVKRTIEQTDATFQWERLRKVYDEAEAMHKGSGDEALKKHVKAYMTDEFMPTETIAEAQEVAKRLYLLRFQGAGTRYASTVDEQGNLLPNAKAAVGDFPAVQRLINNAKATAADIESFPDPVDVPGRKALSDFAKRHHIDDPAEAMKAYTTVRTWLLDHPGQKVAVIPDIVVKDTPEAFARWDLERTPEQIAKQDAAGNVIDLVQGANAGDGVIYLSIRNVSAGSKKGLQHHTVAHEIVEEGMKRQTMIENSPDDYTGVSLRPEGESLPDSLIAADRAIDDAFKDLQKSMPNDRHVNQMVSAGKNQSGRRERMVRVALYKSLGLSDPIWTPIMKNLKLSGDVLDDMQTAVKRLVGDKTFETMKGDYYAVPVRETAKVSVEETPGDRAAVGERREAAKAGAEAPAKVLTKDQEGTLGKTKTGKDIIRQAKKRVKKRWTPVGEIEVERVEDKPLSFELGELERITPKDVQTANALETLKRITRTDPREMTTEQIWEIYSVKGNTAVDHNVRVIANLMGINVGRIQRGLEPLTPEQFGLHVALSSEHPVVRATDVSFSLAGLRGQVQIADPARFIPHESIDTSRESIDRLVLPFSHRDQTGQKYAPHLDWIPEAKRWVLVDELAGIRVATPYVERDAAIDPLVIKGVYERAITDRLESGHELRRPFHETPTTPGREDLPPDVTQMKLPSGRAVAARYPSEAVGMTGGHDFGPIADVESISGLEMAVRMAMENPSETFRFRYNDKLGRVYQPRIETMGGKSVLIDELAGIRIAVPSTKPSDILPLYLKAIKAKHNMLLYELRHRRQIPSAISQPTTEKEVMGERVTLVTEGEVEISPESAEFQRPFPEQTAIDTLEARREEMEPLPYEMQADYARLRRAEELIEERQRVLDARARVAQDLKDKVKPPRWARELAKRKIEEKLPEGWIDQATEAEQIRSEYWTPDQEEALRELYWRKGQWGAKIRPGVRMIKGKTIWDPEVMEPTEEELGEREAETAAAAAEGEDIVTPEEATAIVAEPQFGTRPITEFERAFYDPYHLRKLKRSAPELAERKYRVMMGEISPEELARLENLIGPDGKPIGPEGARRIIYGRAMDEVTRFIESKRQEWEPPEERSRESVLAKTAPPPTMLGVRAHESVEIGESRPYATMQNRAWKNSSPGANLKLLVVLGDNSTDRAVELANNAAYKAGHKDILISDASKTGSMVGNTKKISPTSSIFEAARNAMAQVDPITGKNLVDTVLVVIDSAPQSLERRFGLQNMKIINMAQTGDWAAGYFERERVKVKGSEFAPEGTRPEWDTAFDFDPMLQRLNLPPAQQKEGGRVGIWDARRFVGDDGPAKALIVLDSSILTDPALSKKWSDIVAQTLGRNRSERLGISSAGWEGNGPVMDPPWKDDFVKFLTNVLTYGKRGQPIDGEVRIPEAMPERPPAKKPVSEPVKARIERRVTPTEPARERVRLPETGRYTAKDQAKSDLANKFIGRGSPESSTEAYRQAWDTRANTGTYSPEDVVFVSAEGKRTGRIEPDFTEIDKAMKAGATIVTDKPADRNRPYNVGEREVATHLIQRGYVEEGETGRWIPDTKPMAKEPPLPDFKVSPARITDAGKEQIIGPMIMWKGKLYRGVNHDAIVRDISAIDPTFPQARQLNEPYRRFLTSTGRHVDRKTAAKIWGKPTRIPGELHSEDMGADSNRPVTSYELAEIDDLVAIHNEAGGAIQLGRDITETSRFITAKIMGAHDRLASLERRMGMPDAHLRTVAPTEQGKLANDVMRAIGARMDDPDPNLLIIPGTSEEIKPILDAYDAEVAAHPELKRPTSAEAAKELRQIFDDIHKEVNDWTSGYNDEQFIGYVENYLTHRYQKKTPMDQEALDRLLNDVREDVRMRHSRRIPTYTKALTYGLKPVSTHAADMIRQYSSEIWRNAQLHVVASHAALLHDIEGDLQMMPEIRKIVKDEKTGKDKDLPSFLRPKVLRRAIEKLSARINEERMGIIREKHMREIESKYNEMSTVSEMDKKIRIQNEINALWNKVQNPVYDRVTPDWTKDLRDEYNRLFKEFDPKKHGYKQILSNIPSFENIWAKPEAENYVRMFNDKPWDNKILNAISEVNQWSKYLTLNLSLFHPVSMYDGFLAAFGVAKALVLTPNPIGMYRSIRQAAEDIRAGKYNTEEMRMRGLGINVNPDIEMKVIDARMKKMVDWSEANGHPVMTAGFRKWAQFNQKWNHWLWETMQPGMKVLTYTRIEQEMRHNLEARGVPYDLVTLQEDVAGLVNRIYGGLEMYTYKWATPHARQVLGLGVFAPDWTFSALQISGLTSVPGLNKLLDANLSPTQLNYISKKYWPGMAVVLLGIPNMIQGLQYLAVGDPQQGDRPFTFQNEEDKKTYIDFTPSLRHLGWVPVIGYEGGDTGKRRVYTRWGKQSWEVLDGWLTEPRQTFLNKTSAGVRMAYEQITNTNTAGWKMPWTEDPGMLSGLFSAHDSWLGSRSASVVEKFIPMSVLSLLQGKPSSFFAPTSRGVTIGTATTQMENILETYGDPATWQTVRAQGYEADLARIGPEVLDAAERNGIDSKEVLQRARVKVLSKYYGEFFKALNKNDTSKMEQEAESILRLNGTLGSLMQSVDRRAKSLNRPYTSEMAGTISSAFEEAQKKTGIRNDFSIKKRKNQ